MVKFLIIATGFNCSHFVPRCIESVRKQTYANYEAVFISDGSTDTTAYNIFARLTETNPARKLMPQKLHYLLFSKNEGAAKRRFDCIKEFAKDPDTVVLLLGLDDELYPNCLARIAAEYEKGVYMTYGNWKNQHAKMLPPGFLFFDEQTHIDRSYRSVKYRSTAPNTFKRFLFDELTEEDFKIDGEWLKTTTESPLMFACLEMCGKEKIGVIQDAIYHYNEFLPGGTLRRLGADYKYKIYNQIINRPKKPLYESNRRTLETENG